MPDDLNERAGFRPARKPQQPPHPTTCGISVSITLGEAGFFYEYLVILCPRCGGDMLVTKKQGRQRWHHCKRCRYKMQSMEKKVRPTLPHDHPTA